MSETVIFAAISILAFWIVFLGGAERLEGTIKSAFLIQVNAPFWHATGIKVYIGISWLAALTWLILK